MRLKFCPISRAELIAGPEDFAVKNEYATVILGISTVELGFIVINWEYNEFGTCATELSPEGVL